MDARRALQGKDTAEVPSFLLGCLTAGAAFTGWHVLLPLHLSHQEDMVESDAGDRASRWPALCHREQQQASCMPCSAGVSVCLHKV